MSFAPADPGDFWGMVTQNAIPALFTSLTVKDPNTSGSLSGMLPFYAQMASDAQQQRQLALAAKARAEGAITAMPTPGQAAGQAAADTATGLNNAQLQQQREMQARGVKPGSGADMAAYGTTGALGSSAIVNNANTAGATAGKNLMEAKLAAGNLYDNVPGASEMQGALGGMGTTIGLQDLAHQRQIANTMAAFKPLDTRSFSTMAPPQASQVISTFYGPNGTPTPSTGNIRDYSAGIDNSGQY
jgi:hypothetical protein